jgi:protein-S-isoprenylcysteine O-methyltransferase Ste14
MKERLLTRGNLRDIVVILALVSAWFYPIENSRIIVGIVILTIGTIFHFITKCTLIREVVLCNKGIYRVCRHPYYLSNFIVDISFCLLSGNVYLVLAYPFLFFWAYGPTFVKEESFLHGRYPEQYLEFLLGTPQVLPCKNSWVPWSEIVEYFSLQRLTAKQIVRMLRFWTVSMFILLVHEVGAKGVSSLSIHAADKWVTAFAAAGLILLVVSFIVPLVFRPKASAENQDE